MVFAKTDPNDGDYSDDQVLQSSFIETILLKEPWRSALTRLGVRIVGARFKERLDLSNAGVTNDLVLMQCQLDGGVDLSGMTSTQGVSIINSRVAWIDMGGAKIGMQVDLRGDRVGSHEANYGTTVSIDLEGADIGDVLDLGNGGDDLAGAQKQDFESKKADLSYRRKFGADISSKIRASGVKVKHAIYLNNTSIFRGSVDISFGVISESLSLAGGTFDDDVDATGTQIGSELTLSTQQDGEASWAETSELYLHNARADAIPGFSDRWPNHLELNGFVYRTIDEGSGTSYDAIDAWFRKQEGYGEQPYEQLAQVLQSRGSIGMAKEVRFLSRDRVRREQSHGWTWIWQTTLWLLIGYGYYPEWAIWPIVIMVACGVAVLAFSGQGRANGMPYGIAYSFDMLLPIIKLREMHYDIDLKGWARYYFYAHKIAGWALASFLVAGLAGLTK